jgi:3-dehydroquinate dehydratase-2
MPKILILNGPNLNLLGTREPEHYGRGSLDTIEQGLQSLAKGHGYEVVMWQSNAEDALIDRIHAAGSDGISFILFNPAAFTHTSIALRDALLAVKIPFIEIHLSNIHAREAFRQKSYFSDIAQGVISGLGPIGYELALRAAMDRLENQGTT